MGGGAISAIATMTMNTPRSTYPDELDEPQGGLTLKTVNNLEHAKILIEKAKRQADDWETEEAAVTFSIPLVSGLVEEVENCAAPWPDWWGLRTTTNSAQWRPLFVWQQCPMRIRCPC